MDSRAEIARVDAMGYDRCEIVAFISVYTFTDSLSLKLYLYPFLSVLILVLTYGLWWQLAYLHMHFGHVFFYFLQIVNC